MKLFMATTTEVSVYSNYGLRELRLLVYGKHDLRHMVETTYGIQQERLMAPATYDISGLWNGSSNYGSFDL